MTVTKRKKRHHIFLWFFLAVQALFVVWIIVGANSGGDCPAGQEGACEAGTAIGVAFVVALWVAVDIILGFTYLIYKLARRD
jgi:hypothetical protein